MKNLKWFISILTLLVIFSTVNVNNTEASGGISIYINGEKQSYSHQAIIEKGRTLVPMRGIFESFGASVQWNQEDKTIRATKGETKMWMKIGFDKPIVNQQSITISVPPQIKNGRTLVPLRFISQILGKDVKWVQSTKTIHISERTFGFNEGTETDDVVVQETGNIKGAVTWQYNEFIGTKADVGARVFLIPYNFNPSSVSKNALDLYAIGGKSLVPEGSNLHYAEVNGFGRYELNDIPAGKYVVVIASQNTSRDFRKPVSTYVENILKPLLGNGFEQFKLFNLEIDKHAVDIIEIEKNKTLDVSTDFGYTFI